MQVRKYKQVSIKSVWWRAAAEKEIRLNHFLRQESITNPEQPIEDDGFAIPPVKPHSRKKYRLISHAAQIFSRSMKRKWNQRVYIDLFAGAGYAMEKVKGEVGEIIKTSALISLEVKDPFDKYIFCDINPQNIEALKARVERNYPNLNCSFLNIDSNRDIDKVMAELPKASKENTCLSFCVVDPFNLGNLKFHTVNQLASKHFIDFLVLIERIPRGLPRGK